MSQTNESNVQLNTSSQEIHFIWSDLEIRYFDFCQTLDEILKKLNLSESDNFRFRTILSELLNNAIDHGLLELDSNTKNSAKTFDDYYLLREKKLKEFLEGKLEIHLTMIPFGNNHMIRLSIHDSGQGFSISHLEDQNKNDDAYSGRGIAIVRCFCENIEYSEGGSKVEVTYITSG